MIDLLTEIDTQVFLALNSLHTEALDQFMSLLSHKMVWIPFYMMILCIIVRRYGWRAGMLIVLGVALGVTVADQTCATFIRPLVQRLRPAHPDSPIVGLVHIVGGYRGGNYGFPSCHAANTLAVATFMTMLFRHRKLVCVSLWAWVVFNCYSRIYLGVHYPGDLIVGGLIGGASGFGAFMLTLHTGRRLLHSSLRSVQSGENMKVHLGGGIPELQVTNSALIFGTGILTTGVLLSISLIGHFG